MQETDLCYTPAVELVRLIRAKAISPVEAMDRVLEDRTVNKGDVVALFRGLELKIEAWQDGQDDRLTRLERRDGG